MRTGVYSITNLTNGKRYIGSAAYCVDGRWRTHRMELRRRYHFNPHLQSAWDKYGEASFVFELLEECVPCKCLEREQFWMDAFDAWDNEHGYNLSPIAGSVFGLKHSKEARAKKSTTTREAWKSPVYRQQQIQSRTGKKRSLETRQRMSKAQRLREPGAFEHLRLANFGRQVSQETRDKISQANKGRRLSDATRQRMSIARTGHPVSELTRNKISVAKRRVVKETT